jgi:hypothetical protein
VSLTPGPYFFSAAITGETAKTERLRAARIKGRIMEAYLVLAASTESALLSRASR